MAKLGLAIFILVTGLAGARLEAGFRSPESLVRNVYAYYGSGSPGFSSGLPHDAETARQFFSCRPVNDARILPYTAGRCRRETVGPPR